MGYYIRVLSPSAEPVARSRLSKAIDALGLGVALSGDNEESAWEQLIVSHSDGKNIAAIERNLVEPESLGGEELDEFLEDISECQPKSSVAWLKSYLPKVQTIYAIQILSGTYDGRGWDVIDSIKDAILSAATGIVQADNEGFTNEDGYHILWQFSDDVTGEWSMAVLKEGCWHRFGMEPGNRSHRAHFLRGEVPPDAKSGD